MAPRLSPRLTAIVDALPLAPGARLLEIGCGPGAAAREIACRIGDGYVLCIDRSAKAIALATAASQPEMAPGVLSFRPADIEDVRLEPGEALYDIALAIRVDVPDGRHPEGSERARRSIAAALKPGGLLFIDGGDPLREVPVND